MGKFFTTLYFTPSYKNLNNLVVGIFSTLFTHLLADLSPATWGQILLKIFLESAVFFYIYFLCHETFCSTSRNLATRGLESGRHFCLRVGKWSTQSS